MNKMIEIKNLTKSYNGVKVVDNISLKVNDGRFLHLLVIMGQVKQRQLNQ